MANGAFPEHPLPLSVLRNADRIICCDGATEHLLHFGRTPNFIVGDLDSISADLRLQFADILIQIAEQETNDAKNPHRPLLPHFQKDINKSQNSPNNFNNFNLFHLSIMNRVQK
ncbi:hypothetical protein AGMMS4957_20700 [Bacteroidia bacterium]|nr:hypothetical protein AGMMS4957_20700 [Bacteroidia bacterium]